MFLTYSFNSTIESNLNLTLKLLPCNLIGVESINCFIIISNSAAFTIMSLALLPLSRMAQQNVNIVISLKLISLFFIMPLYRISSGTMKSIPFLVHSTISLFLSQRSIPFLLHNTQLALVQSHWKFGESSLRRPRFPQLQLNIMLEGLGLASFASMENELASSVQ